jgi:beta-glucosidase
MGVDAGNLWNNTWFNDPVFLGRYPEEGLTAYGAAAPQWTSQDMEIISSPLDFLGLNIYTSKLASGNGDGWQGIDHPVGCAHTDMGWPVRDDCLYWGPRFHAERYKVPLIITENGMANLDWPQCDGRIDDPQRVDYIRRHLLSLQRCVSEGIDVRGYFYWSLLDNFEWAEGFQRRFGLIYVDFESGSRILKSSAHWYRNIIGSNGRLARERA